MLKFMSSGKQKLKLFLSMQLSTASRRPVEGVECYPVTLKLMSFFKYLVSFSHTKCYQSMAVDDDGIERHGAYARLSYVLLCEK